MTEARHLLLETLARKVRLLTLDQGIRLVGGSTISNFRRDVVCPLAEKGLIRERKVMTVPLLELVQPLATWRPGEEPLPEEAIAEAVREGRVRWRGDARLVSVVEIMPKGSRMAVGRASVRWSRASEVSHDLSLGNLLVSLDEEARKSFRIEGHFDLGKAYRSKKKPDAVCSGITLELIGARYRVDHVVEIAETLTAAELPFELW